MRAKITMKIIGRNEKGDKRIWNIPNPKNDTKRRYVEAFMERCFAKGLFNLNNTKIDSLIGIKRLEYDDWYEKDDACLAKCAVEPEDNGPGTTNPPAPPAPVPPVEPSVLPVPTPVVPPASVPPAPSTPALVTPAVAPAPTFKSRATSFFSNMLPSFSF